MEYKAAKHQDISLQCCTLARLRPLWSSDRKTQVNPMSLSYWVMEAFSARLYPPESNHHLQLDALRGPEVRFLVARDGTGKALATGAVVLHGDWAEIKQMWVEETARGRGIARQILSALMAEAGGAGVKTLRLKPAWPIMPHWPCTKRRFQTRGPFCRLSPRPAQRHGKSARTNAPFPRRYAPAERVRPSPIFFAIAERCAA
jgi:putative acetyltransferase